MPGRRGAGSGPPGVGARLEEISPADNSDRSGALSARLRRSLQVRANAGADARGATAGNGIWGRRRATARRAGERGGAGRSEGRAEAPSSKNRNPGEAERRNRARGRKAHGYPIPITG